MNMLKKLVSIAISCVFPLVSSAQALHMNWLDKSVNPGQNFYQFANGTWQKNTPIPDDYARWGTFQILQEQNLAIIHEILINAEKNTQAKTGSIEQKVGDFYFSGMNEAEINKLGSQPLKPELDKINQ